jgi:hypothetical protein
MHSRTTSVDSVPRVVYVTKTRFTDWSIRKTTGDSVPRVVYVIKARLPQNESKIVFTLSSTRKIRCI